LAQDAIALYEAHGFEGMTKMIAKRAGGGYEPKLAELFILYADKLMAGLDGPVDRETILALEPAPHAMLDEQGCDEAFLAIADMIDMRMPFTFGPLPRRGGAHRGGLQSRRPSGGRYSRGSLGRLHA
jgi:hypothetical protein